MILNRKQIREVACPVCRRERGQSCRSVTSSKPVHPHKERSDLATETFYPEIWQEIQATRAYEWLKKRGYPV